MCGRFTQKADKAKIEKEFVATVSPEVLFKPRYNIAPTQMVPVVLNRNGARIVSALRWGLIPSWAKDVSIASKLINARAETLSEKPSFKNAFRVRRCIIPASGFYEWQKQTAGAKQPFYFFLKHQDIFGLAGLWESWLDRQTGEAVETFTIITTEANACLEPIHERMPVILKPEDYEQWLDERQRDTTNLQTLLAPFSADEMDSYAVSRAVNFVGHDAPELAEKVQ